MFIRGFQGYRWIAAGAAFGICSGASVTAGNFLAGDAPPPKAAWRYRFPPQSHTGASLWFRRARMLTARRAFDSNPVRFLDLQRKFDTRVTGWFLAIAGRLAPQLHSEMP